jgi:dienelactone hydrolase
MVQFWYPADLPLGPTSGPYLRDPEAVAPAIIRAQSPLLPAFLLDHLRYVQARSYPGTPVAGAPPSFPVIVFCHGYGGYRTQNTALCEELASHGYVVVAPEFAYSAAMSVFPDGRHARFMNPLRLGPSGSSGSGPLLNDEDLLAIWVQDARFAASQLERLSAGKPSSPFVGRLDLARLGVIGHSFGGATAINLCRVDPRFKAGFDLDGHPNALNQDKTIQTPFAFFMATSFLMTPDEIAATGTPRALAEDIAKGSRAVHSAYETTRQEAYLLVLKGSRHETFTDMPLYSPYAAAFGFGADIAGAHAVQTVNAVF